MNLNKILFIIGLMVAALLFCSCHNENSEANMEYVFPANYLVNDLVALEDVLTTEYNLEDLLVFFENSGLNEGRVLNPTLTVLSLDEVNKIFPVEIIRTKGYSVYKVSQGGYFYVFWINTLDNDLNKTASGPVVYFSAYLPYSASDITFDSFVPGVSTAEDVKRTDPFLEFNFLLSSGTFSYCYLNDKEVLQVEYTQQEEMSGYKGLIIKELTVVKRDIAPSKYSTILLSDLPQKPGDGTVF